MRGGHPEQHRCGVQIESDTTAGREVGAEGQGLLLRVEPLSVARNGYVIGGRPSGLRSSSLNFLPVVTRSGCLSDDSARVGIRPTRPAVRSC